MANKQDNHHDQNHDVVYPSGMDPESKAFFEKMAEYQKVRANKVNGVKTVLIVISARGMVFDIESLRQKVLLSYPEAAVFFRTTLGKPIGALAPERVDLLIDFTGPRQRQGLFYARKLRKMARVAVGRNAGLFRKKLYDRVYDEKAQLASLPVDLLKRERIVQRFVLEMAGVAFVPMGDVPPDRGKITPLELPPLARS
jgi:hypothetical protein